MSNAKNVFEGNRLFPRMLLVNPANPGDKFPGKPEKFTRLPGAYKSFVRKIVSVGGLNGELGLSD